MFVAGAAVIRVALAPMRPAAPYFAPSARMSEVTSPSATLFFNSAVILSAVPVRTCIVSVDLGFKDVKVIISIVVLCSDIAIVIIKYDGRRPGLPSVPLDIEYDSDRTEE